MTVKAIWKVPALYTGAFKKKMTDKNLRQDGYATFLNQLCGFNFWYETDESFGDISEETAHSLARNHSLTIQTF